MSMMRANVAKIGLLAALFLLGLSRMTTETEPPRCSDEELIERRTPEVSTRPVQQIQKNGLGETLDDENCVPNQTSPTAILGPESEESRERDARSKLSPDLLALLDSGETAPVPVIVRLTQEGARDFSSFLTEMRGSMGREVSCQEGLEYIGATVVELAEEDLLLLARRADVERITLDREISSSVAMSLAATGADQVWGSEDRGRVIDGEGVTIAVVDSGVDLNHPDFGAGRRKTRVRSVDFVSRRGRGMDRYGHGTHVAGIVAGNGRASLGEPVSCAGTAPAARILNLRVLREDGVGYVSSVIRAIGYAIDNRHREGIRILNLSLGHPVYEPYSDDPLCVATGMAVEAGIAVVVAAGNSGTSDGRVLYGGIHSPGNAPWVITVGATKTNQTVQRSDDEVASYSSRGPTVFDGLFKPDLVAPGNQVVACRPRECFLARNYPRVIVELSDGSTESYMRLSGTSMATPLVSGTLALMFDANPSLTPSAAKAILLYTAEKMREPDMFSQGNGSLNAIGAVSMARAIVGTSSSSAPLSVWLDSAGLEKARGLVEPYNEIGGEEVSWGGTYTWGDGIVRGSGILWSHDAIWGQGILWSHGILWSSGEPWFDPLLGYNHHAYGHGILWSHGGGDAVLWADGILWSHSAVEDLGILWSHGILWSNHDLLGLWDEYLIDPASVDLFEKQAILVGGESYEVSGYRFGDKSRDYYPEPPAGLDE